MDTVQITGSVKDKANQALPGANVEITGTSYGGVADFSGKY